MNPIMCEFDEGKPHEMQAEYMVSKRNEEGRFNRETALCHDHFIDYALSDLRWILFDGTVVCHFHMKEKKLETSISGIVDVSAVCYFCRGGQ